MSYILILVILVFLVYPIFSARNQLIEDNAKKPYTSVTVLMAVSILISIVLSIVIALNADMPNDIGFGGFTYIIGPSLWGIVVLIFYLISVGSKPNLKFPLGIICVLTNIVIGFNYCYDII